MAFALGLGAAALAGWFYLIFARGGFWLAAERDEESFPEPRAWPAVAVVVPARNEADVIARALLSLLGQDYPGAFRIFLVDDESADGTAAAASALADSRVRVIAGTPRPAGWAGKPWAMRQGVEAALAEAAEYILFTDADIAHAPDNLARLVRRAESRSLVLTTVMVRLASQSLAEKALIPAFVLFFSMVNPFAWANDPDRRTAAAAGGCMLVRCAALAEAGGIEAIAGEIIDDCALARRLKAAGATWLGLTDRAWSLRPYGGVGEIAAMVSRSAYAQLRYSPWRLGAMLAGLGLLFVAPPILTIFAWGPARWLGVASWAAMAVAFQPMLRFYRRSPLWGAALPLIGAAYAAFTLRSAIDAWRGRGGAWKGRLQAQAASRASPW
ncbi:MAG: glycosyltransferase [Caulobacteraceae bacterium]